MTDVTYSDAIVISLGGSLVVPDSIDHQFLRQFRDFVYSFVNQGKRFFLIVGGGKTARRYQQGLMNVCDTTPEDLDWIGIHATRLNAQLVKTMFGDMVHDTIITDPSEAQKSTQPITVGAGWKPGCSTDYDAVLMAQAVDARVLINLSNIDYVYDKDPKQYPDAKKITEITWTDFRELLPAEWKPGLNTPFDPLAVETAESLGLEVALLNGDNPDNIRKYITRDTYIGTVITP